MQSDNIPSSPTARQRRGKLGESDETATGRQPLNDRRPNLAPVTNRSRQKGAFSEYANDENLPINEEEDEDEHIVEDGHENEPIEEDYEEDQVGDIDDGEPDYGDDAGQATLEENVDHDEEDRLEEEPSPVPAAKSRANKRKAPSAATNQDTSTEDAPQEPPRKKRGKPQKSQKEITIPEKSANVSKATKKGRPPKAAVAASTEPLDLELQKVVESHVNHTGPLKGRSLYILKREVPTDQQAAHTRSGRVSVRPLAYWRNERCVYGDGEVDLGQRYPLSTIKEIIRTEELEPEKKAGKKRKTSKKSKTHIREDESDDDERDVWETEEGILHGYIKKWDAEKQAASNDEETLGKFCFQAALEAVHTNKMQKLPSRPWGLKHEKSRILHSAWPNYSANRFSAVESSSCQPRASNGPKTQNACTWFSTSVTAGYKLTSTEFNSQLERVVYSKYQEVNFHPWI